MPDKRDPPTVEVGFHDLKNSIREIANGPEMTEQEYRYRARTVADEIMEELIDAGRDRDELGNKDMMGWEILAYAKSTTYIKENDPISSPLYYHRDEMPESLLTTISDQIDYFLSAAQSYYAREIAVELRRRNEEEDKYHETDISLEQLIENVFEDYLNLEEVYIEFLPSLEHRAHILITVHTEEASEDRHFPDRYSTDRVVFYDETYPLAVCETSSTDELPQDKAYSLSEEKEEIDAKVNSWIISNTL